MKNWLGLLYMIFFSLAFIEKGESSEIYTAKCLSCHGPEGKGSEQGKAPKLKGLESWYLSGIPEKIAKGERKQHPLIGKSLAQNEYEEIIKYIEKLK